MFLNLKSKHIKGAIAQIEKKQGKRTCESIPFENPNIKKQKLNQNKTSPVKRVIFHITLSNSGCKCITGNKPQF